MRSGVACAAALLLLVPASASATVRYVSPHGAASGPCDRAAPCSAAWALAGGGSVPGDEVVVGRGTYVDQPLVVERSLTVTAAPDAPRPLFRTTSPGAVALRIAEGAGDSVVEHLDLRSTGPGGAGVQVAAAATLDDLVVRTGDGPCLRSAAVGVRLGDDAFTQAAGGPGPCVETTGDDTLWDGVRVVARRADTAASFSGNGQVTDVVATGRLTGLQLGGTPEAHRITASGDEHGIALSGTSLLTDSVAIARRGGSAVFTASGSQEVLYVTAWAQGPGASGMRATGGGQLTVKSSIARGRDADLLADPSSPTIGAGCLDVTGCAGGRILVEHSNFRRGFGVESTGPNQSADPRFVRPGAGNFHLRARSPAIDAGTFELNSTSADRAGRFRWLGLRPDMGAYEYPSPRPPSRGTDRRPPTLGVVRLTRSAFRAGRGGVAFSASRRAAGTTLVYVVSEDADVVALVSRVNQRHVIGAIVAPSRRGANRLRIAGRPLRPGRYVLTVIARDIAQNLSAPKAVRFTVVR